MSYEVLARKWRPQVFQDVVGQEHISQTLVNAIKTGRLAHAYLFGGPRGVGKTSVARILAKAINCEQGEPGNPCNSCQSCLEITDGSSVDVQEIDGASNRGIDEIRELRENIRYMPSSSRYRIYIIDEVHMLTLPAFNALLKTLEEPPGHVKFIFATTECHKVPITILSRCQRFDFKRISPEKIIGHLEKITRAEGITISETALSVIAREAEGSMRDAESLLDQVISFTGPRVEDRQLIEILGVIDRDTIFEASRAIIKGCPKTCLEIVDRIYNHGYDIKEFYRALLDQFRNILVSLIAPQGHLLNMSEAEMDEARRLAEGAGADKIQFLLNFLIRQEEVLRFSSHPRLILETTMIRLCTVGDFLSFGDLLRKIESLEKRLTLSTTINEQSEIGNLSESGAMWIADNREKDNAHEEEGSPSGQTWDDFLTFLSSKNKATFNILKNWRVLKMTENFVEIGGCNQSFSSAYFDDPKRYKDLSDYCRDFFRRNIRVKIVHDNKNQQPTGPSTRKTNSDLPTPVQDILDMFQGEIREGYPAEK